MKKIIAIFLLGIGIVSCNEDALTNLNEDTKNPISVPAGTLFGNAQKNLFDQMVSTNVNQNVFRLFSQHWTETTYLDESRYDILQRNIPDNHWRAMYRDVLRDLKESYQVTQKEVAATNDAIKTKENRLAIIEILNVFTYSILVDSFGNVPYSEALSPDLHPSPKYDDAKEIYTDLFARLDDAISKLDSDYEGFDEYDFIYGGDIEHWIKFANSIKLRMAITVADDPTFTAIAKAKAEQAVSSGVFSSSADNATIQYLSTEPNSNPLYSDLVTSGRYDFVVASTLVDKMNNLNDPRRGKYFTDVNGDYIGNEYASGGDFENYSSAGDPIGNGPKTRLLEPTLEGILLDYTEVEFYLAEAIERGFNVGGTAESHYNNAITSSILYWGGTNTEATNYLAQSNVAYSTAIGSWRQKIGEQSWLGYYNRGFEAWSSYRRLDFPVLNAPSNAATAAENTVPKRLTYPVLEQTLNRINYTNASSAIGGDRLKNKIFWDKF
jgi:Starch-binding associating with outer membrane